LDELRDELNDETEVARHEILVLLDGASRMAGNAQTSTVEYGLALLALALLLGAMAAGMFTIGLVRPLRRLLKGTLAVEQGVLETEIPVTSRDEVGELTASFNSMVRELRAKARIRETFGRYVDPRIVEGLIENTDALAGGARSLSRRAARAHGHQARAARRHAHRRCHGGGNRRQHRLRRLHELHGDGRCGQSGLSPRRGQQGLRHSLPGEFAHGGDGKR